MFIDTHVVPGDLDPQELADRCTQAALDAAVVTDVNRVDRLEGYLEALREADLVAFPGVELRLEKGRLVFLPRASGLKAFYKERWSPAGTTWALEDALEVARRHDGVLIAGHPYCADITPRLADSVYRLRGFTAMETRVCRGRPGGDSFADEAAARLELTRLGSSGGDPAWLGRAGTILAEPVDTADQLIEALEEGACWPVEVRAVRKRVQREARDDRDRGGRDRGDRDRGGRDRGGRDRDGRGGRDRGGRDRGGPRRRRD